VGLGERDSPEWVAYTVYISRIVIDSLINFII
jgi:hypothetical protein